MTSPGAESVADTAVFASSIRIWQPSDSASDFSIFSSALRRSKAMQSLVIACYSPQSSPTVSACFSLMSEPSLPAIS